MGAAPSLVPTAAGEDSAAVASPFPRAGERQQSCSLHNEILSSCRSVGGGFGGDQGWSWGLIWLVAPLPQSHSACQPSELLSNRAA